MDTKTYATLGFTFLGWILLLVGGVFVYVESEPSTDTMSATYDFFFNATNTPTGQAAGQMYKVEISTKIANHHEFDWKIFERHYTANAITNTELCYGSVTTSDWAAMLDKGVDGPSFGESGDAATFMSNIALVAGKTGYYDGATYNPNAYRKVTEKELFHGKIPTDLDNSHPTYITGLQNNNELMAAAAPSTPAGASVYKLCPKLVASSPQYLKRDGITFTTCTTNCDVDLSAIEARTAFMMVKNPNEITPSLASGISAVYEALNLVHHDDECVDALEFDEFEDIQFNAYLAAYGSILIFAATVVFFIYFLIMLGQGYKDKGSDGMFAAAKDTTKKIEDGYLAFVIYGVPILIGTVTAIYWNRLLDNMENDILKPGNCGIVTTSHITDGMATAAFPLLITGIVLYGVGGIMRMFNNSV